MPKIPDASSYNPTAAALEDAEAQFARAFFLAAGPAPQDYAQAREWYQRAADQDHHLAQFNLGQMFAHGQGMPKSNSMALMWIRRSAAGGDAGAQYDMGDRYARSCLHGSEMDASESDASESRVECYKWFTLAAAQQYRDAQLRSDCATMKMTREEVTEGNQRVRAFVAG